MADGAVLWSQIFLWAPAALLGLVLVLWGGVWAALEFVERRRLVKRLKPKIRLLVIEGGRRAAPSGALKKPPWVPRPEAPFIVTQGGD